MSRIEYDREWEIKNFDKRQKQKKKYFQENKKKIYKVRNKRRKIKYKQDAIYRRKIKLRNAVALVTNMGVECEWCYSHKNLQRHHPDILNQPLRFNTLCCKCHNSMHMMRLG